jgi:hypothetical protein
LTARELIQIIGDLPKWSIMIAFLAPPVIVYVLKLIHGMEKGKENPWKYIYTVIVYWVCIPGVLSGVLTGYTLFFTRENLLDRDLTVYFLPIITMVVTLVLIRKNVSFNDIPGFDRLSGLITVIAVTFAFVLAIQKTRLWVFFGGSIYMLGALIVGLFSILQWGTKMLFRSPDEPKEEMPDILNRKGP